LEFQGLELGLKFQGLEDWKFFSSLKLGLEITLVAISVGRFMVLAMFRFSVKFCDMEIKGSKSKINLFFWGVSYLSYK
jgi:hypothetical protein